ncbi:MAG: hypothetical protein M1816_003296 [Peltula sp. TS41687]|nr:MAG: hypothetical protein M1816_003296 [Peltula sp. TS41687]
MHWIRHSRHWQIGKGSAPLFRHPTSLRLPACLSSTSRICSKRTFIPFADETSTERRESDHQEKDKLSSPIETNTTKQPTTTITERERETFDHIFRSLAASASSGQGPRVDHVGLFRNQVEHLNDKSSLALGQAERDGSRPRDGLSFGHGTHRKTMDLGERELTDIMRYPESLRSAAAETGRTVHRLSLSHAKLTTEPGQLEDGPHKKELSRVIKLMRDAKTDRDLWSVLVTGVFSMVRRPNEESSNPKRKSKKRNQSQPRDVGDVEKSSSKDGLPPRPTVGPNYPHLLLLAMRIFRYDFQQPSACLALFAQVKAHGSISYVLGATTTLYNEIIGVKWRFYGDFHGIDELLVEMEKGGVDFDEETLSLLQDIGKERRLIMEGEDDSVMRDLWGLDGVREGLKRVATWKEIVGEKLVEKAIAINRRE